MRNGGHVMIDARMTGDETDCPAALLAMGRAAGQLAMLRIWLVGEVSCSASEFANQLHTFG